MFLASTVVATAAGQLSYKLYFDRNARRYLAMAIAAFLTVPFLSYGALRDISLDVVYMATSLTIVLVTGCSISILRERMTPFQWTGSGLVVLGVIVYNL